MDVSVSMDVTEILKTPNPVLFVSKNGKPMSFHLQVGDDEEHLIEGTRKVLEACGGQYITEYDSMTPYTILLVTDDGIRHRKFKRPAICLTYVGDCAYKNTLWNINEYIHPFSDAERWEDIDLFSVVYSFEKKFQSQQNLEEPPQLASEPARTMKRGRGYQDRYRTFEKAALLKWLVNNKKYEYLKGSLVWREMERRNVVPNRSAQSLKNQFLKYLVNQLDQYPFLTEKQKKKLRGEPT